MSDLGSLGWSTIFKMGGKQVVLPEELSRKWWDKKKQLAAKTHATGVGEELDKLKTVFEKIEWFSLSGNPNAAKIDIEKAKSFSGTSEVTSFVKQLRVVRELAKKEAVTMKKSALTKKTGETLDEISTLADHVSVICNPGSLGSALEEAIKDWDKQIKQKFVAFAKPTLDAVALVNKKIPGQENKIMEALKVFLATPKLDFGGQTPVGILGNLLRDLCRDMTQPLGNLMKSAKSGVPFADYDGDKIATLYKKMVAISDSKSSSDFMDKLDPKGVIMLVNDVKQWGKSFTTLTADIKIE